MSLMQSAHAKPVIDEEEFFREDLK
jgi:hypothetical protein